jgi:hypothetical protein
MYFKNKTLVIPVSSLAKLIHKCVGTIPRIDGSKPPKWSKLSFEDKQLSYRAIINILNNYPKFTPEDAHEVWMKAKINQGWKYGEQYNETAKLHPSIVPYDELPDSEKLKDEIWASLIKSFRNSNFIILR